MARDDELMPMYTDDEGELEISSNFEPGRMSDYEFQKRLSWLRQWWELSFGKIPTTA